MADTNISGSNSNASAYNRALTRAGLDALGGLAAHAPGVASSRLFRLGPLAVRLETQPAGPTPAVRVHITEAARRLADQIRAFNFKEELDAGACCEALVDQHVDGVRERLATKDTQRNALDALAGLLEAAPQRTPAAGVRAYGAAARGARDIVPPMICSQV